MSIRVVCPNGHLLKIKNKYSGKSGLCPVCRGTIMVPEPDDGTLSDVSIMEVLDPEESGLSGKALQIEDSRARLVEQESANWWEAQDAPLKICARCDKEIASDVNVCPFCKTYVGNLRNQSEKRKEVAT